MSDIAQFRQLAEQNPILVETLQKALSNGLLVLKTGHTKSDENIELPHSWVFVENIPLWPQFIMRLIEDRIHTNSPLAIILTGDNNPIENWLSFFGLNKLPACIHIERLTPNTTERVRTFLAAFPGESTSLNP